MPNSTSDYQLKTRASRATEANDISENQPLNQTVHDGDSHEPLKFSVRREMEHEGGNSNRVIAFIIVVVAMGLGLTLLVQSFISGQSNNNGNANTTSSAQAQVQIPGVTINTVIKEDSQADRVIDTTQYGISELNIGSAANAVSDLNLATLTYTPYTSFSEILFGLSDGANGLPPTKVSYNPDNNIVSIDFSSMGVATLEMLQNIPVSSGNVQSITIGTSTGGINVSIQLVAEGRYFASVDGKTGLRLYVQTENDNVTSSSVSSVSSVATTTTSSTTVSSIESTTTSRLSTTTSLAAGGLNFDNNLGQNSQSLVSAVTGNSLVSETYYYADGSNAFTFSWAIRGTGEAAVPNTTATYVTDAGKNYIEVKISNLSYDLLHAKGREKAIINISTASSNLVDVYTKGFSGGTATFWVEVKAKKDFRLFSNEDYNGYRLVSLQLAD